jgi:hypothetical protein
VERVTKRWLLAVAVTAVVTAALVVGLVLVVRSPSVDGAGAPQVSLPGTPTPTPSATPPTTPPPTTGPRGGPPAGTVHVDDRYRARYAGRFVGWDTLLASAPALPARSSGCREDWRAARRDPALSWARAGYLCLDQLTGNRFKPQGVAGTGATQGYRIGGRSAADRNIVVVTSYSSVAEAGLRFPHRPGETDTTRLTVVDLDRRVHRQVELVRPTGAGAFTALDSHGSGVVWVGQYLYTSSRGSLWMYNADDLMEIDGRFVLPAVARWTVSGTGGLSSIGLDRSTRPASLTAINYSETGTAWSQTIALGADGRVRNGTRTAGSPLRLTSAYGPVPATVVSTRSRVVEGTNFQGIGTSGRYRLVNSSSLMLDGRRHGDNVVVLKRNRAIARFAMPSENVESLYLDFRRNRYVTVTEHGRQFLFWLPLDHLIERAER